MVEHVHANAETVYAPDSNRIPTPIKPEKLLTTGDIIADYRKETAHQFQQLLTELRSAGIPVSTSEWLDFQRCLQLGVIHSISTLYNVGRMLLVKDVQYFDIFDQVMGKLLFKIRDWENLDTHVEESDEWSDANDYYDYDFDEDDTIMQLASRLVHYKLEADGAEKQIMEETYTQLLNHRENLIAKYIHQKKFHKHDVIRKGQLLASREGHHKHHSREKKFPLHKLPEQIFNAPAPLTTETDDEQLADLEHTLEEVSRKINVLERALHIEDEDEGDQPYPSSSMEVAFKAAIIGDRPYDLDDTATSAQSSTKGKLSHQSAQTPQSGSKVSISTAPTIIPDSFTDDLSSLLTEKTESQEIHVRLTERKWQRFDADEIITPEQVQRVVAKLRSTLRSFQTHRTKKINLKKTVKQLTSKPGLPEIIYQVERNEKLPKVIIFVDVSGSVKRYIPVISTVLSGLADELADAQMYYFFNGIYETVYTDQSRINPISLQSILQQDPQSKVLIYGDGMLEKDPAVYTDGSSPKSAIRFFQQLIDNFPAIAWIHPVPSRERNAFVADYLDDEDINSHIQAQLLKLYKKIQSQFTMFDLTLNGLNGAITHLMKQ